MNYYPLHYPINKRNVKKFIDNSDKSVQASVKKLIETTEHISYEYFIKKLHNLIQNIAKDYFTYSNIYIFIDETQEEYTTKSNYWLYVYIIEYVKKKYNIDLSLLIDKNFTILPDNSVILFVDDCIYSGSQMAETIANLIIPNNKKLYLILSIPFASITGINKVTNIKNFKNSILISYPNRTHIIKSVFSCLTQKELENIMKFYNTDDTSEKYLIYFDHKLADNLSTYSFIYSGVVPNNKNMKILEEAFDVFSAKLQSSINDDVYERRLKQIADKMDIYPLLTKCEDIKNIDIFNTKCPISPYKKEYIKKIKSLIKKSIKSNHILSKASFINKSANPRLEHSSFKENIKSPKHKKHKYILE